MRSLSVFASLTVLFSTASAHFTLDYPPTRGFDEDKEPQFCGGFPVSTNRTLFPLSGGQVQIDSHHTQATFVTLISFDANPSAFSEFNQTSSGQPIPYLKPFIQLSGTGEVCIPVDIASLGVPGVQDGTNATIQVQFNGGDGELYQCADITLTSQSVNIPSCTNTSMITGVQSVSTTAAASISTTGSAAGTSSTSTTTGSGALPHRLAPAAGLAVAAAAACFALL